MSWWGLSTKLTSPGETNPAFALNRVVHHPQAIHFPSLGLLFIRSCPFLKGVWQARILRQRDGFYRGLSLMSVQLKLFEENIKHNPISPPWTLSCWLSKHTIAMIRFVVTLFNYPFSPTVLVDPAIPILIGEECLGNLGNLSVPQTRCRPHCLAKLERCLFLDQVGF